MANSRATSRIMEPERPEDGKVPPQAAPVADLMHELKASAHLMSLPAGLFCILHEPASPAVRQGGLPGIRISLPPNGATGVEITGFRADGWLASGGDAALVRVARGPAQVLVTIYQLPNQPGAAPKLQVRQLLGGTAVPPAESRPAEAPLAEAAAPAMPLPAAPQPAQKFDLLAHLQGSGDVSAKFGAWLGEPGSGNWIEGFAIAPLEGFDAGDLSYQAVLGRGWLSPWVEAGQYCGSRGMALPLLGFRIRLRGAAAEAFELSATASFVDGGDCGPVGSDQTCESEKLAPLEAMTIGLSPRARKAARPKR